MTERVSAPTWFWVIAVIALIWNLLGVIAYIGDVTMSEADLAAMDEGMRNLYETTPAWATSAYAVAVWGGFLGGLLLVLRKSFATVAFIISLAGIIVQMYHALFISNSIEVYGPGEAAMPIMVIIFGIAFILFSRASAKRNWIN